MTLKQAKRVDSLARNLKQLPLYTLLCVFVPLFWLFLPLITLAYWWARRGVLADYHAGRLRVEEHDLSSQKPGKPSPAEQLDFVIDRGGRKLVLPAVMCALGSGILGLTILAILVR